MLPEYAELHCLSNFTFLRGASHPEELVERAHALGYGALALTDECSVAGAVRAHVAAARRGLKLVIGAEASLADGPKLVLLAASRKGYGALCALLTRARTRAAKGAYRIERGDLEAGLAGCIALLVPPDAQGACPLSPAAEEGPGEENWWLDALEQARFVGARFPGRAWIAAELSCGPGDRARLAALAALSAAAGLPLAAAGNVHMHARSRRRLQDVLTAIRLGVPLAEAGGALHANGERHLRTRLALARIYPPGLLAQTVEIARRCDFSLASLRYEYPAEVVPAGETPASHLRRLTLEGARRRFPGGVPARVAGLVEHELLLISEMRYEHFFLTVHDIVCFARSRGILCQGRGSAANSAVCYCLGITEVDPSRMSVLFERFISRERNEPPDIDVDFEHERREEVIQYIYGKYGRERAALAATVITYRLKSALRDTGKALGFAPDQIDRLAGSLAWWDRRDGLRERLVEAGIDPDSREARLLVELVERLVGFPRHLSQHTGGFVISGGPLSELVPVENAAMPERSVIQWDKDDLDQLGLLKVDVLALGMLTAIRRALDLAGRRRGAPLTMQDVLDRGDDAAVYEMIRRADTIGVFQIESRAQMSMLPRLAPRVFYDLVIEIAIVRPGPIQGGMVHPYLRRRQALEPVTYPSAAVEEVLKRTLGVPIFQEQVMQLAIVAAGFSPGEADRLRRSMAAWRRKGGLEPFRERLASGMRKNGYPPEFAGQIYRQICGFGEYGFPESHSASFALIAYVSAWLKHHEPAAFLAALLNSQPMGFYAPPQLVQDARRHGVEVRPVDVAASEWECTLESRVTQIDHGSPGRMIPSLSGERPGWEWGRQSLPHPHPIPPLEGEGNFILPQPAVRLGLLMVKGLSQAAAERIAAARAQAPFVGVEDLARRAALDRRDLRCLAGAGALASLAGHRRLAHWQSAGIAPRPPLLREAPVIEAQPPLAAPREAEDLVADYRSLGLTLGRHPLALLRPRLLRMRVATASELSALPGGSPCRAAGIVTCRQCPGTANGVVFVTLEDETGCVNVVVWRRLVERQRRELLGARLLGVDGLVQREGEVVHLVARRLTDHSRLLGRLATRSRDFH
ncbi:MAG: error-prone DNA polymerase [Burkholderiales bacterium]|nr:error-prone DNA polymerase [Burkholderiales bacterium]